MPNNRIFFACESISIAPVGSQAFQKQTGIQSIGMTTTFNLEQAFEIGQIQIYQNLENIPDVEITLEKIADGTAPVYCWATSGSSDPSVAGRSNAQSIFALDIYPDSFSSASGVPIAECQVSGCYVSQFGFTFPIDGFCTENISLIANQKIWTTGVGTFAVNAPFSGNAVPPALASGGGINRRQNVIFTVPSGLTSLDTNGQLNASFAYPTTILPPDIDGISSSGTNTQAPDGHYYAYIQNISCSVDLGRTSLYQQGRKSAYYRYVQFPVPVKTTIEVIATKWDSVSATEAGLLANGNNLYTRTIKLHLQEGLYIDLGLQNKLDGVTYGGGGVDGGNVTIQYSYTTFNDFTVYHPADPSRPGIGY